MNEASKKIDDYLNCLLERQKDNLQMSRTLIHKAKKPRGIDIREPESIDRKNLLSLMRKTFALDDYQD